MTQSMNESVIDKGIYRTAPATPGLLNIVGRYGSKDSKSKRISELHDWLKIYDNFNNVSCP